MTDDCRLYHARRHLFNCGDVRDIDWVCVFHPTVQPSYNGYGFVEYFYWRLLHFVGTSYPGSSRNAYVSRSVTSTGVAHLHTQIHLLCW